MRNWHFSADPKPVDFVWLSVQENIPGLVCRAPPPGLDFDTPRLDLDRCTPPLGVGFNTPRLDLDCCTPPLDLEFNTPRLDLDSYQHLVEKNLFYFLSLFIDI